jgi:hypothetical protein
MTAFPRSDDSIDMEQFFPDAEHAQGIENIHSELNRYDLQVTLPMQNLTLTLFAFFLGRRMQGREHSIQASFSLMSSASLLDGQPPKINVYLQGI